MTVSRLVQKGFYTDKADNTRLVTKSFHEEPEVTPPSVTTSLLLMQQSFRQ